MAMKRRQVSLRATILTTTSCSRQYCFHSAARRQHGVHQLGRERIVCHRGAHRLLESRASDLAQADAERLQRVADGVLQVEELGLEVAPVRQEKLRPVAAFRLDVSLAEPARAHQMGNAERIGLVGLVALRGTSGAHMHRLQADRRQADLLSSGCSQGDSDPASWPTRRSRPRNGLSVLRMASASVITATSKCTAPSPSTTHTAVSSIDTSSPQKNSIRRLLRCLTGDFLAAGADLEDEGETCRLRAAILKRVAINRPHSRQP
jgi:hypothetical protein